MEKVIDVTALASAVSDLLVLTDAGRIYVVTKTAGVWEWNPVALPEYITVADVSAFEKVDPLGRMPEGYTLYKRSDTGLFYWEQAAPADQEGKAEAPISSEHFERMEGAIAHARNDYMIRNRPAPAPRINPL